LALEGGRLLQESQGRIALLADAGCVYITLTHNKNTSWADSATDNLTHNGLTAVGKRIVKWIEEAKILVDVSHASDNTIFDVLKQASRPVIASHSGVLSLVNHPRNLSDALIKMIAATGGVIGIPYATKFVNDQNGVVLAIDHIAQLLGTTRHIAIGSDLDGAETVIEDVSEWSAVLEPLYGLGYTTEQVDGIKGENFLRLLDGPHQADLDYCMCSRDQRAGCDPPGPNCKCRKDSNG
jgi:membrane dipeptidase